jgi:hypothetical protein
LAAYLAVAKRSRRRLGNVATPEPKSFQCAQNPAGNPAASLDFALKKCEHFNPLIEITRT